MFFKTFGLVTQYDSLINILIFGYFLQLNERYKKLWIKFTEESENVTQYLFMHNNKTNNDTLAQKMAKAKTKGPKMQHLFGWGLQFTKVISITKLDSVVSQKMKL